MCFDKKISVRFLSAHLSMNRDYYLAAATAAATTAFTTAVIIYDIQFIHGFHLLSNRCLSMNQDKKRCLIRDNF